MPDDTSAARATQLADSASPPLLDWRRAHDALERLAATRAALDWEEGRALLQALRSGAHLHLGCATFAEYIEHLFGYKPRWTHEKLRVAEAMENLPALTQALRDAILSWSAIRELVRVATSENEAEWIEAARNRTVREIEELVSGRKPGDRPDDDVDDNLRRHVLRFEVSGEVLASIRDAMAKLRRDTDAPLDDDAALFLMARHVLGGPTDEARASYQVAVTICGRCDRAWQQGRGELVEIAPEVAEMACCDAQHIGDLSTDATHVGHSEPPRATQDVPPRIRRQVMRRDCGRCCVPGCRNATYVDVHHLDLRSEGGSHDTDNLVVMCAAHHRALHSGRLIVEGTPSTGLIFRHADGAVYGRQVSPKMVGVYEKVFSALRGMGFREGEARRAMERVRGVTHVGTAGDALKAALAELA